MLTGSHLSDFVPFYCTVVRFPVILVFYPYTWSGHDNQGNGKNCAVFILLLLNYRVGPAAPFQPVWANDPFPFNVFSSTLK